MPVERKWSNLVVQYFVIKMGLMSNETYVGMFKKYREIGKMNVYKVYDENIKHNINVTMQRTGVPVWGVLKYNGYGIGLLHMAKLLSKCGITRFAVCDSTEAHTLRQSGFIEEDILLLSPQTTYDEIVRALLDDCIFSVGSREYADILSSIAGHYAVKARIHVAVDTGLGRFGFSADDIEGIGHVYGMKNLKPEGIYSHFSAAASNPSYTKMQFYRFQDVLEELNTFSIDYGMAHIANSAGVFKYGDMNLDAVRIGSAFLGRVAGINAEETGLTKTGELVAKVCEVKDLKAGNFIGYNCARMLWKNTKIAVLSAGRLHGIPMRTFGDRIKGRYTMAKINNQVVRLIVTNCESHAIADVTGLDVHVGDFVHIDINPIYLGAF